MDRELKLLRRSGLDVAGDIPWGTHFCQFYATKQDLLDVLVPYFKAGLEDNEYCMWVTAEPLGSKEAEAALRAAMPDFDAYVKRAAIEIIPHTDWYLVDGVFDKARVLEGWVRRMEQAIARGFDGLRITGNTFWLEPAMWQSFYDYEATINSVIGRYRMIAVCTYSVNMCGAAEIIDVVENHQFSLVKRQGQWSVIRSAAGERKDLQAAGINRELQQRTVDLEAAVQELQGLSYSVAHQLHAPLRAIDGYARLLGGHCDATLDSESRRLIDGIRTNAKRMGELIDDVVTFTRTGRVEVRHEYVDMEAAAASAWEEVVHTLSGKVVDMHQQGPLPRAWGDRLLLRQVFFNLFNNAVTATRNVTGARIEIGGRIDGTETLFWVKDNGIGFDPRFADRLFEPMGRVHGEEQFPGSGFGLAIVKRIAVRHGGRVWAEGKEGHGASFGFALPTRGDK